jgi:hypothetical protein
LRSYFRMIHGWRILIRLSPCDCAPPTLRQHFRNTRSGGADVTSFDRVITSSRALKPQFMMCYQPWNLGIINRYLNVTFSKDSTSSKKLHILRL